MIKKHRRRSVWNAACVFCNRAKRLRRASADIRFSLDSDNESNQRITPSMTDSEREEILRQKSIIAPVYSADADKIIEKEKDLTSETKTLVKSAMDRIATVFGVYGDYNINDVDVVVSFSIENLIGGYIDGDNFVPVRFGLKYPEKGKPILYVVVSQEKIKTDGFKDRLSNELTASTSASVTISITDIVPSVNSKSKDLLRYLPDGMLNKEQRKEKWEAIADTIKKTNDKKRKHI